MNVAPRAKITELAKESLLTGRRFLFVEGPTDKLFFTRWIEATRPTIVADISVMTADGVEVSWEELKSHGLTEGARQRVVWISERFPHNRSLIRCVADLDCGDLAPSFANDVLKWTDYPAIESYGYSPRVIDVLNESFLRNHLPPGSTVVEALKEAVIDLYRIRFNNPGAEHPSASNGFKSGVWDPARTTSSQLAAGLTTITSPVFDDSRQYAYGHDIALLLLGRFGNEIKNKAKVRDPRLLEDLLRASILQSGVFNESGLASELNGWLQTASTEG